MLKLKILNRPKMLKLKCISKFPDVVLANLQEKIVNSSTEQQVVQADRPYDGLSKVMIEPYTLEEKTVTPSKETQEVIPDKSNGLSKVVINGDENLISDNIRQGKSIFGVEGTMEGGLDTSQFRQTYGLFNGNGTLTEAPYLNTENVYSMSYMFSSCKNLEIIPDYNTSNVTSFESTFQSCYKLVTFPNFNTEKAIRFYGLCSYCTALETIPLLICSNVNNIYNAFSGCSSLTNLGGFFELGKKYTMKNVNYSYYTLDLSASAKLTHESLMNVINNLYDLNLTYNVANGGTLATQKLVIGSTNIAKLTPEEIAIATNKGWTVS